VLGNALNAGHADFDCDHTWNDNVVPNAQYSTYFSYGKENRVFAATAGGVSAALIGSTSGYTTTSRTPVAVDATRLADTVQVRPGGQLLLTASATVGDDTAGGRVCMDSFDVTDRTVLTRQRSTSDAADADHTLALQAVASLASKISTSHTYALDWYVDRAAGSILTGTAPSRLLRPP
jgi:hypothetical protein